MKRIIIVLVAVALVGCSSKVEPNTGPPKANLLSLVIEGNTGQWKPEPIPQAEAEVLRQMVAAPPDQILSEPLELEAFYIIEIDGTRYTLEPNEIITMGNTRIWKSEGIQKRILEAVRKD